MKNANVVEVRDLGPLTPLDSSSVEHDPARIDRMSDLLRRYPHVGEAEKAELLLFLRRGPSYEVDLVGRREGIASRLMHFRRDHPEHFRLSGLQVAGFVALVLGPLMAFVWACFG
ncbi:MAG: hypothetical protein ACXWUN_04565 [Allosphingosinicella sp.]